MRFQDHFSGHAADYARHRPRYPAALFEHLARLAPRRELAWDCAAGSGQAALGLAGHFRRVVATDASAAQIAHAAGPPSVGFAVAAAEQAPLQGGAVDLVVVAQALHWLDLERFHAEVRRVLRPGGVLAVWCYALLHVDPAFDAALDRLYRGICGPYWLPQRALVEAGYGALPFPFDELPAPRFAMQHRWSLAELLRYVDTWSAARRFAAERGHSPVDLVRDELQRVWGAPERVRTVRWPLHLRIGRVG